MTRDARMTLTVAVACVLSSVVLYPLFIGSAWFYAGAGAVITVAACGVLSRLRKLPVVVCLAIGVAGLLLYLNLVFEARHSWVVIPTPDSIRALWNLAGTGIRDSRRYAPPAPVSAPLVLLSTAGIGITAVAADLIAVRLRSAALAGLPLLILFTVPATMNAQHEGVGTAVVFCLAAAGYLAMLSADGRDRIRVWGRLVSLWRSGSQSGTAARGAPSRRIASREAGPDTRALAAAGRRVGLASVVLAICVPLIVPGLHPSKLFSSGPGIGGSGSGSGAAAIALPDTLQDTLRQLQDTRPATMLTYTTSAPAQLMASDPPYLQTYAYDTLDASGQWTDVYTAGERQASALPAPQGLTDPGTFPQYTIAVSVINNALTSKSLPTFLALPYPATQVSTPAGSWLTDANLTVFSQSSSVPLPSYRATFASVVPTATELTEAGPPPSGLAADVALPASFELTALKAIAKDQTAGFSTEYGKVNALAAWLSGPVFSYVTGAPQVNSPASLLSFLTKGHAGVCVQSAYAMTVLTRLLGFPARLAGGFTEGTRSGSRYVVKTDDAHAWAEVYFSGYGWIKFEATPGGGDGSARASGYQTAAAGSENGLPPGVDTVGPTVGPHGATALPGGLRKQVPDEGGPSASLPARSAGTPWAAIALAAAAAIALAGGIMAMAAAPAQRALQAHPADGARRRRPVSLPMVALVVAAAAIVALALYRLLSRTSGPDLRAGWATVGIAFGVAAAVALVVPGVSRVARRRWRWLRAGDDAGRAHAAWREFRDDLQDLGVGCLPSEPPRTLAGRVSAGLPEPAQQAVRRLALAEERACYAAQPSGSASLRQDGTAARRGIEASAAPGARWRARIFPASVLTALADGAARSPERLRALVSRRWTERRSPS
jgi:transglutaminase-like putative cysteine protease